MIALGLGIGLDILFGDPAQLPHPIRAIGGLTSFLERRLNAGHESRGKGITMVRGAVLWTVVTSASALVTAVLLICAYKINCYTGLLTEALLTYYILATGSLRDESMKVYDAVKDTEDGEDPHDEKLIRARKCLSMIVGRDTQRLDKKGIIRGAVETVAENTCDGVIGPLIYTAAGGPILGMTYKAVNTMDSMIGYHNETYEYFGRWAARADDLFNFIPSRLGALFMIGAACLLNKKVYDGKRAYLIWKRDRLEHKSPNSAQTESACAGALGLRLAGDAYYGGILVKKPYIGDHIREISPEDIKYTIRLMFASEALCTAVIYIIMMLILIFR